MIRPFELSGETRLALMLLTAALLVSMSRLSGLTPHIADDLDLSVSALAFALFAGSLGGLAVIGVAIVVDTRGPHPVMPLGALVAAAGLLMLSLAGGYGSLVRLGFGRGINPSTPGHAGTPFWRGRPRYGERQNLIHRASFHVPPASGRAAPASV